MERGDVGGEAGKNGGRGEVWEELGRKTVVRKKRQKQKKLRVFEYVKFCLFPSNVRSYVHYGATELGL